MQDGEAGRGDALQRALDELADGLGRPVTLDSPDGAVLGHSVQSAHVDPVRVTAILTRRVPDAVLAFQRSHGIATAAGPVRVPANPELEMTARTCLPVRRGGRLVALLWVLDDDGVGAGSTALLEAAGERIAQLLPATDPPAAERQLAALLAGRPHPDLMDHLARLEQRVPGAVQFVCTVAITAGERVAPQRPDRTAALAAAHAHGQTLALVAEAARSASSEAAGVVRAASPAFRTGQVDLDRAVRLAARAVVSAGCAAVDGALPRDVTWDDLGLYRSLLLHTRPEGWSVEAPLLRDDDPAAASLRNTVETYLDLGGDAARTIAALGIHRTTFYYRLDRLTERYGVRLGDGLVRSELHVGLKVSRLARARERFVWTPALIAHLA